MLEQNIMFENVKTNLHQHLPERLILIMDRKYLNKVQCIKEVKYANSGIITTCFLFWEDKTFGGKDFIVIKHWFWLLFYMMFYFINLFRKTT